MRAEATGLVESARNFALANAPTDAQILLVAVEVAQNLATVLGGRVQLILPGNIIIARDVLEAPIYKAVRPARR